MSNLKGLAEFKANIQRLGEASKTAARKYTVKLARRLVKDIKEQIPGSKLASVRKAVGSKVKSGDGKIEAKVGFGVGKRSKTPKRSKASIARGGVGMSKQNIHWYVLGTKDRTTKKGWRRGRMPAHLGIIARALWHSRHLDADLLRELRAEIEKASVKRG